MTKVLVITGTPSIAEFVEMLQVLRARGVTASVVADFDISELNIPAGLAEIRSVSIRRREQSPEMRRMLASTPAPKRRWKRVQNSSWAMRKAREADILVALDQQSVHAVWELAQRHRRPQAVFGLAAALRLLDTAGKHRIPAGQSLPEHLRVRSRAVARGARDAAIASAKAGARTAVSGRLVTSGLGAKAWTAAVALPGVPEPVRRKLANRLHLTMLRAGQRDRAVAVADAALRRMSKAQRAPLLASMGKATLSLGLPPKFQQAVDAQLELADDCYASKDYVNAAGYVHTAYRLLFNRNIHFDRLESPMSDDPDQYLAHWRRSTAIQRLAAGRGRSAPAAPAPLDRPLRLLIATNANASFLSEIREHYAAMPGVEVRYIDLDEDKRRARWTRATEPMVAHLLAGSSAFGHKVEEWLGPHLEWADTVFIDWCSAAAVLFNLIDPGTTRIVIRLHSFEAFSLWPHMVDFGRVDDLVFVSEHLKDQTLRIMPHLLTTGVNMSVIANAMNLREFVRPKKPDARFTVGLVGTSSVAKDPRWAIEVIRAVREVDPRYRLLMFGSDIDPETSAAVRVYHAGLADDLAEAESDGAVVRMGHVDDVAGALEDVGTILSSSVRESFHVALVEGAASGAVPVVRDWPFFASGEHGARTLFPNEWVVADPAEAARRILDTTASEEKWLATAAEAADYAMRTWDWSVVQADFDRLFLGHLQPGRS